MKNKTNILYVFGGEKASGAEIVIERLISHNIGAESHLFIAPGSFAKSLLENPRSYKVIVNENLTKLNRSSSSSFAFILKALKNYFYLFKAFNNYIREHKIEIVHANTIVPATYLLPVIFFYKLLGRKVKFVWSDHDLSYFSRLDTIMSGLCVKLYDATLVVSNAVKIKYGSQSKVRILYNGLDTDLFKADSERRSSYRTALGINNNDIIIGIPAVISPRKGQLNLIVAFNNLTIAKRAKLVIAGKYADDYPDYAKEVQSSISENANIINLGFISDLQGFYNACDIIVNNSSAIGSEPLGTTLYEAMAYGKITIASNTGGTPEIITNGKDGLIFPADDIRALTEILSFAVDHIDGYEMELLGKTARETAILKFNIQVMLRNYNTIINSL